MFYGIYESEDSATPGRFTQGNKHYDPDDKYEDQIHALGQKFIKRDIPGLLSPDLWYAMSGEATERPPMGVTIDKTTIKAGGNDAAILTGAPKDVAFNVFVGSDVVWPRPGEPNTLPDGELELSVPAPGLYRIVLEKWPYQQFKVDVEAVS